MTSMCSFEGYNIQGPCVPQPNWEHINKCAIWLSQEFWILNGVMQSQKISPVAGAVSCSFLTASLTRELPCLGTGRGFICILPVSLLLPLPSPAFPISLWVYLLRALPSQPSVCHLPPLSASRNLPIYSGDSTHRKLYSNSCYQNPLELLLLSFLHPVLPFNFLIFPSNSL